MIIKIIYTIAFYLIFGTNTITSQSISWFGKSTINSIVLLQKFENGQYINHGVGILTTHSDYSKPIVVTCEHILRNNSIYVVVNPDTSFLYELNPTNDSTIIIDNVLWNVDGKLIRTKVDLIKNKTYATHPDSIDIGAFPLAFGDKIIISDTTIKAFTNTNFVSKKNFGNNEMVNLGEEVYFVGFPFGIGVGERLEPLLRSGVISWKSSIEKEFLLDAFSYGGNSGSPVFTKMSPLGKDRLKPYLIGMVVGHLGYKDKNYGLEKCVYFEDIETVINIVKNLR